MKAFSAPQHMVVLATKLVQPRVPTTFVARERLRTALYSVLSLPLCVVSASAGCGKTTLLSDWAAALPHPVAWMSLDAVDDDPVHFWRVVISALRTRLPTIGERALALLETPEQPPLTTVVATLLHELASIPDPAPLVVVIDDYHLITEAAIHESVTFFVEHMLDHVHLVLATRIDPDLPLARWRARGAFLEIRTADLQFTDAEAARFFTHMLPDALAAEDIRNLVQRTEGWITGLQLSALALRQRTDHTAFVQSFTGNYRYILDYVQTEVLARQAPRVQRFLMQMAVVERMDATLCTALTDESDSQALLELLERSNVFMVPLDDERYWYRMHDLFREVLLARARVVEPTLIPQAHRRAAHWFAAQQQQHEAISHALAAHDGAFAAETLEQAAPQLWLRGEAQRVHAWITTFPDAVVQQHGRLALDAALRLLESFHAVMQRFQTTQADVEHTVARVAAGLGALSHPEAGVLRRRISLLRALMAARSAVIRADVEQMRLLAEQSMALAHDEDVSWKLVALWIRYWYAESLCAEGALLIPELLVAKQEVLATGTHVEIGRVSRWLAMAYLRAGRLRTCEQECRDTLAFIERIGLQAASSGYLYLALTSVYYASNRLDKAASTLQQLRQIAETWQQTDLMIGGAYLAMQVALVSGDGAQAEQALQSFEALIAHEQIHTGAVTIAKVAYWVGTDTIGAAHAWAQQVSVAPDTWTPMRPTELVFLLRILLVEGNYAGTLMAIDRFRTTLDREGAVDTTISVLALHVAALQGSGEDANAQTVLLRLLGLAADDGHVRVFLDAGELMRQTLLTVHARFVAEQGPEAAYLPFVARVLAAFAHQEVPVQGSAGNNPMPPPQDTAALSEPLTLREQEVLRLLVAGASNAEIAAQLVISLATAKKHVSNILGKLGVKNRVQAIIRARTLALS